MKQKSALCSKSGSEKEGKKHILYSRHFRGRMKGRIRGKGMETDVPTAYSVKIQGALATSAKHRFRSETGTVYNKITPDEGSDMELAQPP
jgi:hypothetical protein